MKVCAIQPRPHLHSPNHGRHLQPPQLPNPTAKLTPWPKPPTFNPRSLQKLPKPIHLQANERQNELFEKDSPEELPRWLLFGTFSFALAFLIQGDAMAFGPEGPLAEEFWDNLRRYGLYFITVSSGAIYTIMLPIFELLKSPVTAILIVVVLLGSLYLLSQVLSAMVGVSEFSYQYAY